MSRILDELKHLKENGPDNPWFGICDNTTGRLNELFPRWGKFSGDHVYPIPNPFGGSASDAFNHYEADDMWNPDHPYGALRLELLDWLIETLEAEEKQNETT